MKSNINWLTKNFNELSLDQLYDMLKLRVDIFVVEQNCPYPDLDSVQGEGDRHSKTLHLLGYQHGQLVAYLRILAQGQGYADFVSIGRVTVASKARGNRLGHELMTQALTICQQIFPKQDIKISAQEHLTGYYQKHGFNAVSTIYLEDNIPHIAMIKSS